MEKIRLRELLLNKNINEEEFAHSLGITRSTLKSYKNGNRKIPLDLVIKISKEYHVTLDWLYGVSSFADERDFMADILLSLDKVFKFTVKCDRFSTPQPVLLINKSFYEYICKVQKLQMWAADDSIYKKYRKEVYLEYREQFREIFERVDFNENQAIEIKDFEGLTVVDILSNAVET